MTTNIYNIMINLYILGALIVIVIALVALVAKKEN